MRRIRHFNQKTLIVYTMGVFDLKKGESAKIVKMGVSGSAAARLASLGINEGKRITVLSFSLFKTSVLIGSGYVRLGLRKSVAQSIEVLKCA